MTRFNFLFSLAVVAALVTGLLSAPVAALEADKGAAEKPAVTGFEARDAWLRAPVMAGRPAAGYLTLMNGEDEARKLVGATSPAAERVEIHTHIREGDRMMMRPVEAVDIPAGETVAFRPHGLHLMLFGLEEVVPGDRVTFTLKFADHPSIVISAEVVGTGEGNPHAMK